MNNLKIIKYDVNIQMIMEFGNLHHETEVKNSNITYFYKPSIEKIKSFCYQFEEPSQLENQPDNRYYIYQSEKIEISKEEFFNIIENKRNFLVCFEAGLPLPSKEIKTFIPHKRICEITDDFIQLVP